MVRIPIEVTEKEYNYYKKRKDSLFMTWKAYFRFADSLVKLKPKKKNGRR